MDCIFSHFNFTLFEINNGLKYLGFIIKDNDFQRKYWAWLVSKIEIQLNLQCNKSFSRGGRLVMMKSILEDIRVYWDSITYILVGTMESIQKDLF